MTDSVVANPTRRVKRGWMNLRVEKVIKETHDTDTFVMVDADEGGRPFDYVAGQYLTFRFDDIEAKPIVRSYTMSSSPCQGDFSAFTVKRVEGGKISNWLCDNVKAGTILRARGPIGKFVYEPAKDEKHLVMVAGGSGVTPFVSIMREFCHRLGEPGTPERMTLLVSFRSKADLICWTDLNRIVEGGRGKARVITTLSREDATKEGFWHGRIGDEMIVRSIDGQFGGATFMTCGPQQIMDHAVAQWKKHGVTDDKIKTESFES